MPERGSSGVIAATTELGGDGNWPTVSLPGPGASPGAGGFDLSLMGGAMDDRCGGATVDGSTAWEIGAFSDVVATDIVFALADESAGGGA